MRILVAPDSYKGSMTAEEIANIIKQAINEEIKQAEVEVIPMADGGEGTIEALLYTLKGRKVKLVTTGPTGEKVKAYYGVLEDTDTVVIEVAEIVGFNSVRQANKSPLHLTTFGIGECIIHALDKGYRKFIICLGGSATNDGGQGMLQALGVTFLDKDNQTIDPFPHLLSLIDSVDYGTIDHRLKESEILVASDVTNPLSGKNGATYIFGPQKGIKSNQLEKIDYKIKKFATKIENHLKTEFQHLPGSGAAGGLGFAMLTINASMKSGAKLIAEKINLAAEIKHSDWIITGEGRTDSQTLQGKLPMIVAEMAKEYEIPSILISGSIEDDLTPFYDVFKSMHSISNGPMTTSESICKTKQLLHHKTKNIARILNYTK